jgi:alkanesulfonate monooxygenase SsuD/methylene tetrahydromethanopterin reductase-like flavin-dependent oxidoreductase (luciferase family)
VRIGIGLPVAVPGRRATEVTRWASDAERLGFQSLAVIDRLVYDNLEPLIALTAAAAVTTNVELFTTVLSVGWRNNPVLLAKQLASIDQISGGRLTAGLGLGGWPDDYALSGVGLAGRGKAFDDTLATLRRVWAGQVKGESSAMPESPNGGPPVLIGGATPAAYARVARSGAGWLAPGFGWDLLLAGMQAVRAEWEKAGRSGRPRMLVERYFCLGADRDAETEHYLARYWENTPAYVEPMRADLLTDDDHLRSELTRLARAGCDDLVLLPCSSSPGQVQLLADALQRLGARQPAGFELAASG